MKKSQVSWPGEPQEQVDSTSTSVPEGPGLLDQAVVALRKHDLRGAVSTLSLVMCSAEIPPEAERYLQQAARELYQDGYIAYASGKAAEALESMKLLVSLSAGDNQELRALQKKAEGFLDAALLKVPTAVGVGPGPAPTERASGTAPSRAGGEAPIGSQPAAETPGAEDTTGAFDFKPLTPADLRG